MRIIAGTHRGRRLNAPRDLRIRPTADRVREAVFNILGPLDAQTVVLDLFAGTGALGLESLSRGARFALFIDLQPQALSIIRNNIQALDMASRAAVTKGDVSRKLRCLGAKTVKFNLVFMDPPYDRGLVADTLRRLASADALEVGARLVVEHSANEKPDIAALPYRQLDARRYGKIFIAFLAYTG